ncbi:MAG: cytochrome b/b6 domain-containing protein [Desulfovibrio sp.]|jgi:thiosulfate reductase cytochrome b subunit|nr:cytochrome b/b6 domain-containing protein [Desulfovibrio sp.]
MRLTWAIVVTALPILFLPWTAHAVDQGKSLKYGGGGLGTVIFDGRMHAGKGYVCRTCHDDLFLTKKQANVRMSDHFTDNLCFKCHNSNEASKDCITCHRNVKSSGMTYSGYMRSLMTQPTADEEERNSLLSGRNGVSEQTRACLSCHGNPDLEAKTERGKSLNLFVDRPAYGVGAHGALPCAACHFGLAGKESFTTQPHALAHDGRVDCKSCHSERLASEVLAFDRSVHIKKTEGRFTCVNCHNAHNQTQNRKENTYKAAVAEYNRACLDCHTNPERFARVTAAPLNLKGMEHSFTAKFQAHRENIMCADCHSPIAAGRMGEEPHKILDKAESLRDCSSCHNDRDSLIFTRVALRDGNDEALSGRYVPGSKPPGPFDRAAGPALGGVLAAIGLHGAARLLSKKKTSGSKEARVYVYPLPTRLFHWINAICFILLLWTGMSIHFGRLPFSPALETATGIHSSAAYALMANFVAFLLHGIVSGNIRQQYLPKGPGIAAGILLQARYYLYGMFKGEAEPFPVSRERRFNPLQQVTYLVVYLLGMPVLILSGILLLLPENVTSGMAGRETLAFAHYCLAVVYGLFLAAHVYLATTGDGVFSLIKSMINGYHAYRETKKTV